MGQVLEVLHVDSHTNSVSNYRFNSSKCIEVSRMLKCVCGSDSFHVGRSFQFIHIKCEVCGHETCL